MPILRPSSASTIPISVLQLDLDVHARRKVEAHECIDCLRCWLEYVDQPLVRPDLELLSRVLVDERTAYHRIPIDLRGERHGTRDVCSGPLRRIHDLIGRLVEDLVIVRLEANADALLGKRASHSPTP